ncbi:MAG: hypothetical protein PVH62_04060 [Anaerolineae bacterium]|jgi:hypothetical protein
MQVLIRRILPTAIAIGAGVITLAGYVIPYPALAYLRDQMVRGAVVVAAFAFVLGFFNVLRVHFGRLSAGKEGWPYSLVLLVAALASLGFTTIGLVAEPFRVLSDWWFNYVLSPLQASAAALIVFALGLAGFRVMRSRRSAGTLLFLLTALIVLLGTAPLPGPLGERLAELRRWWIEVPGLAGMRGLLIGVGLGTLVMGLRVISGLERPHSDL